MGLESLPNQSGSLSEGFLLTIWNFPPFKSFRKHVPMLQWPLFQKSMCNHRFYWFFWLCPCETSHNPRGAQAEIVSQPATQRNKHILATMPPNNREMVTQRHPRMESSSRLWMLLLSDAMFTGLTVAAVLSLKPRLAAVWPWETYFPWLSIPSSKQ